MGIKKSSKNENHSHSHQSRSRSLMIGGNPVHHAFGSVLDKITSASGMIVSRLDIQPPGRVPACLLSVKS